jgi:hypothetical protein
VEHGKIRNYIWLPVMLNLPVLCVRKLFYNGVQAYFSQF